MIERKQLPRQIFRLILRLFGAAAAACLVCFFCGRAALASDWDNLSYETTHVFTFYGIEDLPFQSLRAVAQTEDGFIYVGGYGGLLRYDGQAFDQIDGVSRVISLYPDKGGELWIGTDEGRLICMNNDGTFTVYGKEQGLDVVSVETIVRDPQGRVVFGTDCGVYYLDTERNIHLLDDPRLNEEFINTLDIDAEGNIYGVVKDDFAFEISGLKVSAIVEDVWRNADFKCIAVDPDLEGGVYIGTSAGMVLHGTIDQNPGEFTEIYTSWSVNIEAIKKDRGLVWLGMTNGLGFLDSENAFHAFSNHALNNEEDIHVDYEGNIWTVSSRTGLLKISETRFADLNQITPLDNRVANTTWIKDDLLYVGTDTGLFLFDSRGNTHENELTQMLFEARIRQICEDSAGDLWVCTNSEYGLVHQSAAGEITCLTEKDGLISNSPRTVCELSDGTMVVAATWGVQYIKDGEIVKTLDTYSGIPTSTILSLYEGTDGRVYLGTNGRGIYVVDGDIARPWEGVDELDSGVIMGFRRDRKRDCVWLLTGKSLGCIKDGRAFSVETIPTGMYTGGCYELFVADDGRMMIFDGSGVFLTDADDLLYTEEPDYSFVNRKNGLPHIATANSRNYISPEGVAYIACNDGVIQVDINAEEKQLAYRMKIAFLDLDDERVVVDGDVVYVDSGVKRINIYPYLLSYGLNNPLLSWRLDPFDPVEATVSKEDMDPVSYTNLPGGTYTFRLRLDNGIYSREADLVIIKKKALYEQPLFWGGVLLVFTLVNLGLAHASTRRKTRKIEEKKEQERIASELSMAAGIQSGMLPDTFPAFPDRSDFDIYALMDPAKEVGGDFYDFFLLDDDHLYMAIADVSGKGIPGALFMMISMNMLRNYAQAGKTPAQILTAANEAICQNNPREMFVTVWLGILELSTGKVTCANAGHEYPAVYRAKEGTFSLLHDRHGFVVGGMEGISYREYEIQLEHGDKIFVYTDGVPEAINEKEELFGTDRMMDALNDRAGAIPEFILRQIRRAVSSFAGTAEQFDDMTMLCVEYK